VSGDLALVSRDLLLQVLQDEGLVAGITGHNRYEAVWDACAPCPRRVLACRPGPKLSCTPGNPQNARHG